MEAGSKTIDGEETYDELELNDASYNVIIYGVKKLISKEKLRHYIERTFGSIRDLKLIPYINWNIVKIHCKSKETINSLLNSKTALSEMYHHHKFFLRASYEISRSPLRDALIFQRLNHDCWRQVCKACNRKTQIQLAKVSNALLDIISDIWLCHYRNQFSYDLYEFEFKYELTATELQDFLVICGDFVETLYFNTIFYFPLIQRHFTGSGNLLQNSKKFLNINFCTNLAHFNLLRNIKVHGQFLADFSIKEMARYCGNLRSLKLLDVGTRWLTGKNIYLLSNLTELSLKDCENLRAKHMLRACSSLRNLKSLNINDCKQLQSVEFITEMCKRAQFLEKLKMSAIANATALDAILQLLPHLRILHFSWLNAFADFESLYFAKLQQHKLTQLVTLSFSNDRLDYQNSSKEAQMSPHAYALMRETATIEGLTWHLNLAATEAEMLAAMSQFCALRELRGVYCRPFSQKLLLDLCRVCKSLDRIRLIGCRTDSDEKLMECLQRMRSDGEVESCDISVEGLISAAMLQSVRQQARALPYRAERNYPPIKRSILCEFK